MIEVLRVADDEPCHCSERQGDCSYHKVGLCTCNRVGNVVQVNCAFVRYIEAPRPWWKFWVRWL
jgi:hypothetical protein